MSESPILEYWPEAIAAARIPANNNVRLLQALKINPAISATTAAQPGSPAEGDVYILPASPTGAMWGGFSEGDVVIYYSATWTAYTPVEGLRKFVEDEGEDWQFVGDSSGGWGPAGGGGGGMSNPMTTAGDIIVGGASGTPNRLAKGADGTVLTVVAGSLAYATPAGGGDVVGPGSAVADTVPLYDGTTGKLIKAGGKTIPQLMLQSIQIACSDETTNLTTGTAKVTFRMPYAFTLTAVRASLSAAQTAGSIFTVDINEAGSTILSTKLTIDNSEKTSVTAATPPVISDASLADDAEMTIDIDQVGTPLAKGLKVTLIGYPT